MCINQIWMPFYHSYINIMQMRSYAPHRGTFDRAVNCLS